MSHLAVVHFRHMLQAVREAGLPVCSQDMSILILGKPDERLHVRDKCARWRIGRLDGMDEPSLIRSRTSHLRLD